MCLERFPNYSPHLRARATERAGWSQTENGVDDMGSMGSGLDVKADAKHFLRVGVIGAGVMGSNHARVLAGLPGVTLVGIVDPLPEHRARATGLVGCRAFASLDECLTKTSMPSPSRRRPICITRSRSPASRATSTSWSRSRSLDRRGGAEKSSTPRAAPA